MQVSFQNDNSIFIYLTIDILSKDENHFVHFITYTTFYGKKFD